MTKRQLKESKIKTQIIINLMDLIGRKISMDLTIIITTFQNFIKLTENGKKNKNINKQTGGEKNIKSK